MPIEIKELIIRAVVGESAASGSSPSSSAASAEGDEDGAGSVPMGQQAMVEECVRQVLTILQRSRER